MVETSVPKASGRLISGHVTVERRQRLAAGEDLRDAGGGGEQRFQRRLHLEQHGRAALRHERHIAHELQRIAEPLLGVQQDGPAVERLAVRARAGGTKLRRCGRNWLTFQRASYCAQPVAKSPSASRAMAGVVDRVRLVGIERRGRIERRERLRRHRPSRRARCRGCSRPPRWRARARAPARSSRAPRRRGRAAAARCRDCSGSSSVVGARARARGRSCRAPRRRD